MFNTFPLLELPEHKTYVEVRQMYSNPLKYSKYWKIESNLQPLPAVHHHRQDETARRLPPAGGHSISVFEYFDLFESYMGFEDMCDFQYFEYFEFFEFGRHRLPGHKTYVEVRRSLIFYTFPFYKFPEHKTYVEVRLSEDFYLFCLDYIREPSMYIDVTIPNLNSKYSKYSKYLKSRVSSKRM